jgi:RimJ/RimL family protein N-acetyltransferase
MHHARAWLEQMGTQSPESIFAIASVEGLIGVIGLHVQPDVYRKSAELGYWLGEPYWGKGIATMAVKAMVEYGFIQLGLVRIYANVFEGNPASNRVLEKAGFRLEARLQKAVYKEGRILDQFLYAIVQ